MGRLPGPWNSGADIFHLPFRVCNPLYLSTSREVFIIYSHLFSLLTTTCGWCATIRIAISTDFVCYGGF